MPLYTIFIDYIHSWSVSYVVNFGAAEHGRYGLSCMQSPQHNSKIPYELSMFMHSTASAYKIDHICHAQYQLSCSITHSPCMHINCTTHPALHTQHYTPSTTHPALPTQLHAFHNRPMHTTNSRCSLCKVLWCYSHSHFGWFFEFHPYMHLFSFKNFCNLYKYS